MTPALPTPHLEKLSKALENEKLPAVDGPRLRTAIERYARWIAELNAVDGAADDAVPRMVRLLNDYRRFIDVDLIFDSEEDFLYRQKGQLKLDNSVVEEFLPHLVEKCGLSHLEAHGFQLGPTSAFSAIYFTSSLGAIQVGGGLSLRTKDQDFTISRRLFMKASHFEDFSDAVERDFYIAYVAAECKTNLDKTMFQEACATAHDTKSAVAGAKYYLLCEWLDMTPVSTAPTDIDEVIILRQQRRIGSQVRSQFSTAAGRRRARAAYVKYLEENPLRPEMFQRFLAHIAALLKDEAPGEADVLRSGFF